uniref:Transcription factor n=1 Tax=Elaeophora elaphi TaxID=1147741 RepID=A0A0R3RY99_9BILA
MAEITNETWGINNDLTYSIPPTTEEQLLLLPRDSACFTANTSSTTSASSFHNSCNNGNNKYLLMSSPRIDILSRNENTENDRPCVSMISETTKSDNAEMNNYMDDDSNPQSVYSLFETEYDIITTNGNKFPDWSWINYSKIDSYPKANEGETLASSSFYQLLDMNAEPVENVVHKLHVPSQYQLEELQNFAPYADITYAERTPTVPFLPHTLTRSEYIFGENGNNAEQ